MTALLIAALGEATGKTALCCGLARGLAERGRRVGYFKPIALTEAKPEADFQDKDSIFMAHVLASKESSADICPLAVTPDDLEAVLRQGSASMVARVREAFARVSAGKDVVLVEGLSFRPGSLQAQANAELAQALGAKVVLLVPYADSLPPDVPAALSSLDVVGVIANFVPPGEANAVKESWGQALGTSKFLGAIPEDRRLLAPSVADMARLVDGQAPSSEASHELVENILLGVLTSDSALPYFQGKESKAVVVRSDRPDLQLAAMETSTRCLVVAGETPLLRNVTYRASESGTPMIQVSQGTPWVVQRLEEGLRQVRFRQERKLVVLDELLASALDWGALERAAA